MFDQANTYLKIAASVIGVLTTALTVYAKFRDLRKKWGEARGTPAPPPAELPEARRLPPREHVELTPDDEERDDPPPRVARRADRRTVAEARGAVRLPALALMLTAGLTLGLCLFGLVGPALGATDGDGQKLDPASSALISVMFAVPALIALSGGWGMLHLRGYNTALAASVAVMPAYCACSVVGVPVGVWCLLTLRRPEVEAAFR